MKYTTKSGQDIIDVTIQHFGDLETGLFELIKSNPGTGLNSNLNSGDILTLNNENVGLIQEKNYFKQRNFVVNNADLSQISTTYGDFNDDFNNDFLNNTL